MLCENLGQHGSQAVAHWNKGRCGPHDRHWFEHCCLRNTDAWKSSNANCNPVNARVYYSIANRASPPLGMHFVNTMHSLSSSRAGHSSRDFGVVNGSGRSDSGANPKFAVPRRCQLHIPALHEQPVQSDLISQADSNCAGSPIKLIMRYVNPLTASLRENWPHARVRLDFGYRPEADI